MVSVHSRSGTSHRSPFSRNGFVTSFVKCKTNGKTYVQKDVMSTGGYKDLKTTFSHPNFFK